MPAREASLGQNLDVRASLGIRDGGVQCGEKILTYCRKGTIAYERNHQNSGHRQNVRQGPGANLRPPCRRPRWAEPGGSLRAVAPGQSGGGSLHLEKHVVRPSNGDLLRRRRTGTRALALVLLVRPSPVGTKGTLPSVSEALVSSVRWETRLSVPLSHRGCPLNPNW